MGRQIAKHLEGITLDKVAEIGLLNAEKNAQWIIKQKSILELRQTSLVQGDTALVIAAGPSLHRRDYATVIKNSNFKGTIVAADSALSWCLAHGIVPDLIVTVDPHPYRIVRWFGDPDLSEDLLLRDDYFSRQDMDPKFRENQLRFNQELLDLVDAHASQIRIAIASSASQQVVKRVAESGMKLYWWNPMYDDYDLEDSLTRKICAMNGLPSINAGGNVGSACWVIAHSVLGKKRVGVLGMDLGYYADTPYSRTQYYKEILRLVGSEQLNQVFVRIHNPHVRQEFYADPAYLWYRDVFLEMAQRAECETYNCTGGGILFGPRIHWTSLSDFIEG